MPTDHPGPWRRMRLWIAAHAIDDMYQGLVPASVPYFVLDRHYSYVAASGLALAPTLQFHLPQPGDERLRDVTAILAEDPGSDRTLAELGRAVGAGERTLSRLFRAETGMTFPQWRAQLRLHHSLTLLASGLSVTATAISCGYSTPSAFTAAFHATFGTTPGTYRKDLDHARAS